MLSVDVVGGSDAITVADYLRDLDSAGYLQVSTDQRSPEGSAAAGLVIAVSRATSPGTRAELEAGADVILRADRPLHEQLTDLYEQRIFCFAAAMACTPSLRSAPVLQKYDPAWASAAARYLSRLQAALSACGAADRATFEHMGSTAVPGLSAKPILDLQIQIPDLRHDAQFDTALRNIGFSPAQGSRPDSPGVYRDLPRGNDHVADAAWDKRLFIRPDPGQPAILHVRKSQSPWARYTIQFRDWLRDKLHRADAIPADQDRAGPRPCRRH